jgi:hypothetical protein
MILVETDSVAIRSVRPETLAGTIFKGGGGGDTLLSYINPRHSATSTTRPCKSVDKNSSLYSTVVRVILDYERGSGGFDYKGIRTT